MKLAVAAALGVALFAWTITDVGIGTLAAQIGQLRVVLPFVLALAAIRFTLQASGWRLAMRPPARPTLGQALRAVIAGEAAGYLTWGPISREPVKAMMVSEQTRESVALSAAIVERVAYTGAAAGLVAFSLMLLAVRTNRADWIAPGIVGAAVVAATWVAARNHARRPHAEGHDGADTYRYGSPRTLGALVSIAVIQEVINVMETYIVLAWLGGSPSIETAIAFEGLNRLANAPAQLIPGKLGVLELAGSMFADILRLGNANGLTLVLARRVRSLAWTGVGILLLTASATKARIRRTPAVA